jgi:hypothetical protein
VSVPCTEYQNLINALRVLSRVANRLHFVNIMASAEPHPLATDHRARSFYLCFTVHQSVIRRDQIISHILHNRRSFSSLVWRSVFGDDYRSYCPDDNDANDATISCL